MTLDLKLVLKAGIIWGIVAILLFIAALLLPFFASAGVEGLTLAGYATIFAGVHFSARNPHDRNIIVGLIGGMLAGIIAALLLVVASFLLPMLGISCGSVDAVLAPALIAGIAGALGMEIIKRI